MKLDVIKLDGGKAGSVDLDEALFGLEPRARHPAPRRALAAQQCAAGHAQGQDPAPRSATRPRRSTVRKAPAAHAHGARSAPIFRKGGIYKGPTPRSHGHELTKKFRKLGLCHALSAKMKAGELVIIDAAMSDGKTGALAKQVKNLGWKRALIIDGASVNEHFAQAARNIEGLDILPSMGANVYDILKRDTLVITKAGIEALEARLK